METWKKVLLGLVGAFVLFIVIIGIKQTDINTTTDSDNTESTTYEKYKENLEIITFSASKSAVQNQKISFTTRINGGEGTLNYKLVYKLNDKTVVAREYSRYEIPTYTSKESGEYTFILYVKDDNKEVKSKEVSVNVESEESYNERKAKEEQERQQAAEQAKQNEINSYNTGITFDNLARNPDQYKNQKVTLSGKIIQVMNGDSYNQYRLAVDGDYSKVVLLNVSVSLLADGNILDNDMITIQGTSLGTIDYTSVLGSKITVPAVQVKYFTINQ